MAARTPTKRLNLPAGSGRAGEAAARHILQQRGYTILRENYRAAEGEVDLVASESGEIVFVEVKTRRTRTFGAPEESITQSKAERLVAASQRYLEDTGQEQADWRIDLLAIEMDASGRVVRHNLVRSAVEY